MPADIDRLSSLLQRCRVQTALFHSGPLCGMSHFAPEPGRGFMHVLQRGEMVVTHKPRSGAPKRLVVAEPTLLLYPRPLQHDFHNAPVDGSDFVCATLHFEGGELHPLVRALPPLVAVPLARLQGLEQTLSLLFSETERVLCGQRLMADRLLDVLLLQLLRWLLDHPDEAGLQAGLLMGLAHPKLARALTALHDTPGGPWTLEALAHEAGMSRSSFAVLFKDVVGQTPAEYVTQWRMTIAQGMVRDGHPVKWVASELGYANASSLTRAFTQTVGLSPRGWLQAQA